MSEVDRWTNQSPRKSHDSEEPEDPASACLMESESLVRARLGERSSQRLRESEGPVGV